MVYRKKRKYIYIKRLDDAFRERLSSARCGCSSYGWLTFKYDNPVGKVCRHYKIVFDYKGSLLCVKDEASKMFVYTVIYIGNRSNVPLDDFARDDTLFGIQETGKSGLRMELIVKEEKTYELGSSRR